MSNKQTLPRPTWHGRGRNPVKKYVAFLKKVAYDRAINAPSVTKNEFDDAQEELNDLNATRANHESEISYYTNRKKHYESLGRSSRSYATDAQTDIDDYSRYLEETKILIRAANTRLRTARAALAKAVEQQQSGRLIQIDQAAAQKEFDYIMQLPGVMGVKFNRDGTPTFHVRTSHVHGKRRYDLGDFEVTLRRNTTTDTSVVETTRTRGEFRSWYYEGDDVFCYGERADGLTQLFDNGDYGAFMQVLINSLNGINEPDDNHETLAESFERIPMKLVWKSPAPRVKSRSK